MSIPRITRSRGAATTSASKMKSNASNGADIVKKKSTKNVDVKVGGAKKRKRATPIKEENTSDSELSEPPSSAGDDDDSSKSMKGESATPPPNRRAAAKRTPKTKATPAKKQLKKTTTTSKPDLAAGAEIASKLTSSKDEKSTPGKKAKNNNTYGLSPGESPYPDYPHPTSEECHEVNRILEGVHGKVTAPKTIPIPRLDSSGCGEVPSVLDALIRTRLSAATNGANSSRAFRGLVEKFGIIKEGVGEGSVNWDKVRTAERKDVFEAIQSGGLAVVKSRDIQNILQMVFEENQARRDELVKKEGKIGGGEVEGAEHEPAEEKRVEVRKADASVLSLDHLHLLSSEDAFAKLIQYPGIGPKTASCVLLFCLQRPSFAVDTHVFRLSKWLGWVPRDKATRNSTYAHLDVRIPDDLKYPLHYLFIRHGKTCGWCSAKAGAKDRVGKCPLAHLMVRSGGKGKTNGSKKTKGKKGVVSESEEEAEMSDDDEEEEDNGKSLKDEDDEEGEEVKDGAEESNEEEMKEDGTGDNEEMHNMKVKNQIKEQS